MPEPGTLIVNFNYDKDAADTFIKPRFGKEDCRILDISEQIPGTSEYNVSRPTQLDSDYSKLESAIVEMTESIAKASLLKISDKKLIRDIHLDGLNLFWQMPISEKLPNRFFLKNLFHMKHLLRNETLSFDFNEVYIVLPDLDATHYIDAIINFFKRTYPSVKITFSHAPFKHGIGLRSAYKQIRQNFKKWSAFRKTVFVSKPKDAQKESYANYIITSENTWVEEAGKDRVLGEIKDLGPSCTYLPFFLEFGTDVSWSKKWDASYINYLPSGKEMLLSQARCLLLLQDIQKIRKIKFTGIDFLDSTVIINQLQKVLLYQSYTFLNYKWLRNFFTSIGKANVFYQDEFYLSGRSISQAVNRSGNKKLVSYGVQHGIMYKGHSVYHLIKEELCSAGHEFNGMPKPHKFLVWGNYFKKLVNEFEAFAEEELMVSGNPTYIVKAKEYSNRAPGEPGNRFLWCTTTFYLAEQEFEILKPFLSGINDYELTVRCHPAEKIQDFLINLFKVNKIDLNKVIFSKDRDIFTSLAKADLVFAPATSTVFIDALVLNKKVFRFITKDFYSKVPVSNNSTIITSSAELKEDYNRFRAEQEKKNYLSGQDLLYNDDAIWKSILNN